MGIPDYPILMPFLALLGVLLVGAAVFELRTSKENEDHDDLQMVVKAFVGIVFLAVGSIALIGGFWSTYNFRSIDISDVKALRVIKSSSEYDKNTSNLIVFDDSQSIQSGLGTLRNCSTTSHEHETFVNGYKLQLIFADERADKELYLSVYRNSSNGRAKSVVMPHYYEDKNLNLGDYNCPEFQTWVKANIDPLFLKK